MHHLGARSTGLNVQDRDIFGLDARQTVRKLTVHGFANAAQDTQDQVLAVGLDQEGVALPAQGGLEKDVSQLRLECGMQVDLGLLDGHEHPVRGVRGDQHGQHLAHADADVPVAHRGTRPLVDQHEVLERLAPRLDQLTGPALCHGFGIRGGRHEILDLGERFFQPLWAALLQALGQLAGQGHQPGLRLAVDPSQQTGRQVMERLRYARTEASENAVQTRAELGQTLKNLNDSVLRQIGEGSALQKGQLDSFAERLCQLTESNERKLDELRASVDARLRALQEDNGQKLELIRQTVDEKLQGTLDKRLGESFKLVSDRLELVHRGLGEMQTLASGVGDLKRVLTNVKTRGNWGEFQVQTLLEQILSPEQYASNVATKEGSGERVEFAIKLPGPDSNDPEPVWLPIDAKFPIEDYQRLMDAADKGDADGVEAAARDLERRIRSSARDISEKYINPPRTTDFGILYLPTEGLYAEVLRREGLFDSLQREYRVTVVGPTTLGGLLNSLQMGFRTLAIQKRSSEVWAILGAVKAEFGKFADVLTSVQKKLAEASATIDKAGVRTRAITRKLREVEEPPAADARALLRSTDAVEPDVDSMEGQ